MTTYRERREARADRLEEWADGREAKAEQSSDTARAMFGVIPFGQPILTDHYSAGRDRRYRARAAGHMDRAVEHARTADAHRSKAANIRAAAERAIYDDDPDAVERLTAKLAGLEAQRERVKSYNKSARAGTPDPELLTERERANLASCNTARQAEPGGPFPKYVLANLSGTIKTTRDRLARLSAPRSSTPPAGRLMAAKFNGPCTECAEPIERGEMIVYVRGTGASHVRHDTTRPREQSQ